MHVADECDMDLAGVSGMRVARRVRRWVASILAAAAMTTTVQAEEPLDFVSRTLLREPVCSATVCLHMLGFFTNSIYAKRPEAWVIGAQEGRDILAALDQILARYALTGLPAPLISKDGQGRYIVDVGYGGSSGTHGLYMRNVEKEQSELVLNLAGYRANPAQAAATMAHEIFHAIQHNYEGMVPVMAGPGADYPGDAMLRRYQFHWIAEGMADAVAGLVAEGVSGFSMDPRKNKAKDADFATKLMGLRTYAVSLDLYPPWRYPEQYGNDHITSYRLATYFSRSFWQYVLVELGGQDSAAQLMVGMPALQPGGPTEWVHRNLAAARKNGRPRFPGGLPQAYAEFIAEMADLPFSGRYGDFSARIASAPTVFADGSWQDLAFARPGAESGCPEVRLNAHEPVQTRTVEIDVLGAACFRVNLYSLTSPTAPPAFRINVAAQDPADRDYVCQAVALGSNGVTLRAGKLGGLVSQSGACKLSADVAYAPRTTMTHQNVTLTNVHAAGGSGSLAGTRPVQVRVDFVLGAAHASGSMSPSNQSSAAAPPPTPGAPAAAPAGAATGKAISIQSIQAGAAGAQARHAPPGKLKECETWEPACPVIDIAISQYDERFDTLTAMATSLGAGALLVLDGGPRQVDLEGTYGNPDAMAAMAMELAGSEFAEVSMRLSAPEGRVTPGMTWDNALIDAGVGIMAAADNIYMHSRGPHPVPGSCLSDPPPAGKVEITEVGEGWIKGTFSTRLFENYVQQPWKDPCAARPATGQVSGSFTAPYHDVTQPPVDPELAAYQVWAGLPPITWALTDYDALVEKAVATQRDMLRDWEAERRPADPSGAGGGVGGASDPACSRTCVPGMAGCPNLADDEAERLAEDYLSELPAVMRESMRKVLAQSAPEGRSAMLAIHFDRKGCMDGR
tara:strand:+ start:7289 stop:10009 length:2721 start_codon:yes stop_codon:yes gene_type:complete